MKSEVILGQNEDLEEEVTIQGVDYKVGVYWTGESNGDCEVNYCHVTHLESGLTSSLGCIIGEGEIHDQIELSLATIEALESVAHDLGY